MSVPEHRIAICRRCRRPERRASGADSEEALKEHARRVLDEEGLACHVRVSQCLNCCDAGHTVRLEYRGREVALVGVRTCGEMTRVIAALDQIASGLVPDELANRVYQIWEDGHLLWHRNRD